MLAKVYMSYGLIVEFNPHRIAYKFSILHLLPPSTVTQKLLMIQASHCRITSIECLEHIDVKSEYL